MDIFRKIIDNNLLDYLTEMLKAKIGNDNIEYKHMTGCIMFFIGGSTILQIIPDGDEKITYANSPVYHDQITEVIDSFRKMLNRNDKIELIMKKES
jgi:hypothetical protein